MRLRENRPRDDGGVIVHAYCKQPERTTSPSISSLYQTEIDYFEKYVKNEPNKATLEPEPPARVLSWRL